MPIDDTLLALSARYTASPQFVKTFAGGLYALLPASVRHGAAYKRFRKIFDETAVDTSYVHERLSETLLAALGGVPAYEAYRHARDAAIEAPVEALQMFPLTSKEEIKASLDSYLNSAYGERDRLKMFTGGSTAIPMTFYVHRGVSRAKELAVFHSMGSRFNTEGDGIVLALRGRTVRSAGHGRIWSYEPIKRHVIVSSDHLEPQFMPDYAAALKRWRPRYIHAFPSALYPLLVWLRSSGQEHLLSSVKGVVLTSESVFDHHMRAFRAFFTCPVIVTYGHSERVLLANTLPADNRYHFWPHYGQMELVDADGKPVTTPGQVGEIVGTSFDNLVMPFVRYRTGDYGVLGGASSPTAAGFPVLERIDGRLQEFVVCRDLRLVTVTTLGAAHFETLDQCLRIQYEQTEPGELILRVVSTNPLTVAAKNEIAGAVSAKTQGGCTVHVEEVGHIPLTSFGKQRLLIQHLDIRKHLGAAIESA